MSFDSHANFAVSTVATAPSPASSGTSLVVATGDGSLFPTAPFNATVWPASTQPTSSNAEIVRVTAKSTDTFTITRAQESSSARSIGVGDQIAATITAKTLTDVEDATTKVYTTRSVDVSTSGTSFATGADLLSSALSFTADGTSDYLVTVSCAEWRNNTSGDNVIAKLVLDSADSGYMAFFTSASANFGTTLYGVQIVSAPSAGSHTVNVRLYVNAGTGTVFGSGLAPIMVKVEKI